MTILVYCWSASTERTFLKYLKREGNQVITFSKKMEDYHADSAFALECMQCIERECVDAVFSFDYFPLLSMICQIRSIPYISWIYDCPMLTLQSKTITNEVNQIFCFDRLYTERLRARGAKHCYHLPLAGDPELYVQCVDQPKNQYQCDISFLGNLYNDHKNLYRSVVWDEYERGFLDGVVNAQLLIYGYNFVKQALPDSMIDTVIGKCAISLGEMYDFEKAQMAADVLNKEVSAREREQVLDFISASHDIDFYTGSELPALLSGRETIHMKGYADYQTQMPHVFYQSKINLNITSRTIESGIPLRVMDILSCGGFCLTNYQPEIAEFFEDGVDLVMYTDMEDLLSKVRYYLEYEAERAQIAQNGYRKLCEIFSYTDAIHKIWELVF